MSGVVLPIRSRLAATATPIVFHHTQPRRARLCQTNVVVISMQCKRYRIRSRAPDLVLMTSERNFVLKTNCIVDLESLVESSEAI